MTTDSFIVHEQLELLFPELERIAARVGVLQLGDTPQGERRTAAKTEVRHARQAMVADYYTALLMEECQRIFNAVTTLDQLMMRADFRSKLALPHVRTK